MLSLCSAIQRNKTETTQHMIHSRDDRPTQTCLLAGNGIWWAELGFPRPQRNASRTCRHISAQSPAPRDLSARGARSALPQWYCCTTRLSAPFITSRLTTRVGVMILPCDTLLPHSSAKDVSHYSILLCATTTRNLGGSKHEGSPYICGGTARVSTWRVVVASLQDHAPRMPPSTGATVDEVEVGVLLNGNGGRRAHGGAHIGFDAMAASGGTMVCCFPLEMRP